MFFAGLYILGCFLLRFILYNIISSLKKELCVQLQKKTILSDPGFICIAQRALQSSVRGGTDTKAGGTPLCHVPAV